MKVVINKCFGGFGLSPLGKKRLAELQGRKCFFFKKNWKGGSYTPVSEKNVRNEMDIYAKANGWAAKLQIVDIPDGISWHMENYDGIETIHEDHASW